MNIFISWSKEPSRTVAIALRDWLAETLQTVKPWASEVDVQPGARWSPQIAASLAECRVGVLCVTPENQREPWLLFEAGALAKTLDKTFVVPYLVGFGNSPLADGPLAQFQTVNADENGTFRVLTLLNAQLPEPLTPERLRRVFDRSWPDLRVQLDRLPKAAPTQSPTTDDMLREMLEAVRVLKQRSQETVEVPRLGPAAFEDVRATASTQDILRIAERIRGRSFSPLHRNLLADALAADPQARISLDVLADDVKTHAPSREAFLEILSRLELTLLPESDRQRLWVVAGESGGYVPRRWMQEFREHLGRRVGDVQDVDVDFVSARDWTLTLRTNDDSWHIQVDPSRVSPEAASAIAEQSRPLKAPAQSPVVRTD